MTAGSDCASSLELLEDEVLNFDDDDNSEESSAHRQPLSVDAKMEMQRMEMAKMETLQEASGSCEHRPPSLSSLSSATPAAYMSHLRVIADCASLLRRGGQQAESRQSTLALLTRAKLLFHDNAAELLVRTGEAFELGQPPPEFWLATASLHECRAWLQLVDTVLAFWSTDAASLSDRGAAGVLDDYAVAMVTRIELLREEYEAGQEAEEKAATDSKAKLLATEAKRLATVETLGRLLAAKKPQAQTQPMCQCLLEMAGRLQPLDRLAKPTELQRALRRLDLLSLEEAFGLHEQRQLLGLRWRRMRRIRRFYAPLIDPLLTATDDDSSTPAAIQFLRCYGRYALAAAELERRSQRAAACDPALLAEALKETLELIRRHQRVRDTAEDRTLSRRKEEEEEEEEKEKEEEDGVTFELSLCSGGVGLLPELLLPDEQS